LATGIKLNLAISSSVITIIASSITAVSILNPSSGYLLKSAVKLLVALSKISLFNDKTIALGNIIGFVAFIDCGYFGVFFI
jgi:hypothetical protein